MATTPAPDLSMEDLRIIVIALRKAAHTSHPEMAARERELAYRLARLIPPPFTPEEIGPGGSAEAFRACLERLKLSQEDAAPQLGIHHRTVQLYANGEAVIPQEIWDRLREIEG